MALFGLSRQVASVSFHSAFAGQCSRLQSAFTTSALRNLCSKMGLPRVFFDMTADGQPMGRIVIEVGLARFNYILFSHLLVTFFLRPPCLLQVTGCGT